MKQLIFVAVPVLLGLSGCAHQETAVTHFPEGVNQIVVRADEIKWRTCPPVLPKNCEMTILEGNPKQEGFFTLRFHTTDSFFMPAHTHPKDERVTVLQGAASVAFGADATREDAQTFGPGDFYINARHAVHKVWVEKGTILQITGLGPWTADYIKKHGSPLIP